MQNGKDEPAGFDPIALTLAVWLGMIVSVTGLIRLSETAAAQAAAAQPVNGDPSHVIADAAPAFRAGMVW